MEGVVVDHEFEVCVYCGIDEADAIRGAGGEGDVVSEAAVFVCVGAVDQAVV